MVALGTVAAGNGGTGKERQADGRHGEKESNDNGTKVEVKPCSINSS